VFALGNGEPRARVAAGYAMDEAKRAARETAANE
jgi:hypothetical protein